MSRAAVCVLMLGPASALAQSNTIIDQSRPDRAAPVTKPQAPSALDKAPAINLPAESLEADAPLARVNVRGSTLPRPIIDAAMQPLIGQKIDRQAIYRIAKALSDRYAASDVALYTVEVPQQNFADGVVELRVTEGRVSQVAIGKTGDVPATALVNRYVKSLPDQNPLRRSALERSIGLVQDIPGVTTSPHFLQGPKSGDVVLAVPVEARRFDTMLSLNGNGTSSLGRYQIQADVSGYSLLRPGDSTTLTVSVPTQIERFQYVALAHSQPLGDSGLRVRVTGGYLHTRPRGAAADGNAKLIGAQLSYPVIRSFKHNLYVTLAGDGLNSSDAQLGQFIATEKTRAVRGAGTYTYQAATRTLLATATGSYGTADPAIAGSADGHFAKLNARLAFDQALGERWVVRTKAATQWTDDRLATSELFSLGGGDFGRAFAQSALMGDRAIAGAAELAFLPPFVPERFKGSEILAFTDGGSVKALSRFGLAGARGSLASAGMGVRALWKRNVMVGVDGAYAVKTPAPLSGGGWRIGLNLRIGV